MLQLRGGLLLLLLLGAAAAAAAGARTWVTPELVETGQVVTPAYAEGAITPLRANAVPEPRPAVGYVPLATRYMLNPYASPATYANGAYPYPYPYDAAPHQRAPGSPYPGPYPYPHPVCTQELCTPTPVDG